MWLRYWCRLCSYKPWGNCWNHLEEPKNASDGASFYDSKYIGAEAHDKILIDLPPVQRDLARSILALGKTVVLVVLNGGSVDIGPELSGADAAIEAFYPGLVGAGVIANSIFGSGAHFNRWGRMPCALQPRCVRSFRRSDIDSVCVQTPLTRQILYISRQ